MVQMMRNVFLGTDYLFFFKFNRVICLEYTVECLQFLLYFFFSLFYTQFKRQRSVSLIHLKCRGLSISFSDCWISRYFAVFNQRPTTCVANFRSSFHTKPAEMGVAKDIIEQFSRYTENP